MKSVFFGTASQNIERIYKTSVQPVASPSTGPNHFSAVLAKSLQASEHTSVIASPNPSNLLKPSFPNSVSGSLLTNMNLLPDGSLAGRAALANEKKADMAGGATQGPRVDEQPQTGVNETKKDVNKLIGSLVQGQSETELARYESAAKGHRFNDDFVKEIISKAGRFHGVEKSLSLAVAEAESSFKPDAVSVDGHYSKGLFQLLDTTGKDMIQHFNVEKPYDPFDPKLNAFLGVGYLGHLFELLSNGSKLDGGGETVPVKTTGNLEKLAVAAFNAGIGNVGRAQKAAQQRGQNPEDWENVKKFLPEITRRYVDKVMSLRDSYQSRETESLRS